MKRKTVKRLAYFLALSMTFSNLITYPRLTVFAKENGIDAEVESVEDEETIVETETEESEGVAVETEISEAVNVETTELTDLETRVEEQDVVDGEYTLKFIDEFEGESLNKNFWNYEIHEPGRTNNELQEYTDSEENVFLSDGILVIQAKKEERDNADYYTSGKVTTQNKFDFKYGKIEAKIKVPEAKGLLPAFWMMPTDKLYGQWPQCGEIDIMEVLGDKTDTVYGTIHYGNPYKQNHASYSLEGGAFDSEYHIFSAVWEPGLIEFYVDGIKYHEVIDWYTREEGMEEYTFPAPFDQNFYLQLNLAVGGDWPGYPDETFSADGEQLLVDWVKVWQKDSYDENVKKPKAVFREPDENGNYVVNGDFSVAEKLYDAEDWSFLLAGQGSAIASIADKVLTIDTNENGAGTELYSVQLVQPQLPMKKGNIYQLTFEAKADAKRTMVVDVSAPDNGWTRYFEDTTVELGTDWETYEYFFTMTYADDANGRLEFNLGNQNSIAQIQLRNVKLVVTGTEETEEEKSILADGNYVYNGAFEIGAEPLGYWNVTNTAKQAKVSVTNDNSARLLKVSCDSVSSLEQVVVKQTKLALTPNCEYRLSFDAYADSNKRIQVKAAGKTFDVSLTTKAEHYEFVFSTPSQLTNRDLEFCLGTTGITYVDNVAIKENALIINGKFDNGFTGWTHYAYTSINSSVTAEVIKEDNNKVIRYKIGNTGEKDWHIQFKQNNICLEKGKTYKLSFRAKSDKNRKIQFALMGGGSDDDNRIAYSGKDIVDLTGEYKEYSKTFTMRYDTDKDTRLSMSIGSVDDIQITEEHYIWMDDFVLVEVEPEETDINAAEMIKNGNFTEGNTNWATLIGGTANATAVFENGSAVFHIANTGNSNWNVQLKQSGLNLELDKEYVVKLIVESENTRYIEYCCMGNDSNDYQWYGGGKTKLTGGQEQEIIYTFKMGATDGVTESDSNAVFALSLGKITNDENLNTDTGTVTVKSVSVIPKEMETPQKTGLWVEEIADMTYTGKLITPVVTVHDGSTLLELNKDYKVSYKRNKDIGAATVTVTGIGNYSGKDTTGFKIVPKDIATDGIIIDCREELVETGKNQNPLKKITYNGIKLGNKDYKVEYYQYVDGEIPADAKPLKILKTAGDYQMRITGLFNKATWNGNYTGTVTKDIKVYAKNSVMDIGGLTVKIGGKKSGYSVVCDGTELTKNDVVDAKEKVKAVVTAKGANYSGSNEATYTIVVQDISKAKVVVKAQVYTGKEIMVTADDFTTIKVGDTTLEKGTHFEILDDSYANNVNKGTASVTIKGIGNYGGTKRVTFKITSRTMAWWWNVLKK